MSADNREHVFLRQLEEVRTTWQEKLAELEKSLVLTYSAEERFALPKRIEECRQQIERIAKEIESLKKESQQKTLDILDYLCQKVHDIPIVDRPIEVFGASQKTEPIVAAHWQELMRFWIFKLGQKNNQSEYLGLVNADDLMLMLLSSNRSSREARALSSFAMQCLGTEPDLRDETIHSVIDKAIDNLDDLDGLNNKLNTLMDEAFYSVMQSRFGQLLHGRLLQSYIQTRDARRNNIGCVFLNTAATNSEILNSENATQILIPFLENSIIFCSVEERVDAALRLVEAFYRPQGQKNSARIDFLPDLLLRKVVKVLLTAAEQETQCNYAVSTTAIWALLWLISAKTCYSYAIYTFADKELDLLRQVVINDKHDAFARSWSALILSVCTPEKTIFAQADWIYEWAVVADGSKPQRKLPKISHLNRPKDIEVMKNLIFSDLPIKAKRYVAIALGRLGCFLPEMIDPLLQVFQDDMCASDDRDEALVYLVFTGHSQAISALMYGVNRLKDDTDKYGLPERCFLALIGMGDVDALKQQIELGIKNQIDALAYALAGVTNPQGRKVLESMKNHREKEIRNAVINALRKLPQWDS
ncbi:HEAT repeat domain-containing protein [Nostoc sp.]|uniref:HEAT repeat domain-containing protein n=1 Tax=Nostoc sp. TaxID=1180 RepID=UPI003593AC72